jgi:hypothetical protein
MAPNIHAINTRNVGGAAFHVHTELKESRKLVVPAELLAKG